MVYRGAGSGGQGAVGVAQARNGGLESGGGRGKGGGLSSEVGLGVLKWWHPQGRRLAEVQGDPWASGMGPRVNGGAILELDKPPRTGGTGLGEERGVWFWMC